MAHRSGTRHAIAIGREVGNEVLLNRGTLGLTREDAARLAGISPGTFASIEGGGNASVQLDTLVSACAAVGLKLFVKAYPARPPSLRDTGQLELVEVVTVQLHPSWNASLEYVVDARFGRAIDLALLGPVEIVQNEIERRILDWQAQVRAARVKQTLLAESDKRPVRLVMAIEDTRRNRAMLQPHLAMIRDQFPVGSREIWRSIRTGEPLGRDGLLWIRRPPRR